jgi:hypothetical protein
MYSTNLKKKSQLEIPSILGCTKRQNLTSKVVNCENFQTSKFYQIFIIFVNPKTFKECFQGFEKRATYSSIRALKWVLPIIDLSIVDE